VRNKACLVAQGFS
jgi:hypothetical protein